MIPFESNLTSIEKIKKRNKAFYKLTKEEQRQEIAFDCLNLILEGKIKASNGVYWGTSLVNIKQNSSKKYQKELVNDLPDCQVCARGGMMLSQIRLGNNISSDSASRYDGNINNIQGFTLRSFQSMELEYEESTNGHPYSSNTTEKLANICCNVIENGNFNLTDDTDYLKKYNIKLN